MTWTASFDYEYEQPDPERAGDDFQRIAEEFDGDMRDPAASWVVRVTNNETGESRLIDTETGRVVG